MTSQSRLQCHVSNVPCPMSHLVQTQPALPLDLNNASSLYVGMRTRHLLAITSLVLLSGAIGLAEEGMWTFDNPPLKQLQDKYRFTPTQQWLDHVRLSSV